MPWSCWRGRQVFGDPPSDTLKLALLRTALEKVRARRGRKSLRRLRDALLADPEVVARLRNVLVDDAPLRKHLLDVGEDGILAWLMERGGARQAASAPDDVETLSRSARCR